MKLTDPQAPQRIARIASRLATRRGLNAYRADLAAGAAIDLWHRLDVPAAAHRYAEQGIAPGRIVVELAHALKLAALRGAIT